ncbi:MAG: hypothetical protein OSB03_05760 [Vicinamibacterales bacterium]|nr:hypothetical protein [Vicinamibacterales bacterium]
MLHPQLGTLCVVPQGLDRGGGHLVQVLRGLDICGRRHTHSCEHFLAQQVDRREETGVALSFSFRRGHHATGSAVQDLDVDTQGVTKPAEATAQNLCDPRALSERLKLLRWRVWGLCDVQLREQPTGGARVHDVQARSLRQGGDQQLWDVRP